MPERKYSILMSVYSRADSSYLRGALDSIYRQTCPASEIILVKDGRLTPELDEVIQVCEQRPGPRLVTIELEQNVGLGVALQIGLEACSFPIVARMDADDVAVSDRCEKQLNFIAGHPEVDAVGAWIAEFSHDETNIYAHRIVPSSHDEIYGFAKWRNPFNHMSVMYRKDKVIAAGGYQPLIGFEDYFLWIRMLLTGSRLANIPEVLVTVRAGPDQLSRRGGFEYARNELKLQREMLRRGFISAPEFARNVCIRFVTRVAPLPIRRRIYRLVRGSAG